MTKRMTRTEGNPDALEVVEVLVEDICTRPSSTPRKKILVNALRSGGLRAERVGNAPR
jgi:hypothetical protein